MIVAKFVVVWFLLAIVAVANGVIRESTYGKLLSDLTSHQISTVLAILSTGAVGWIVQKYWAIQSTSQAYAIGFMWLTMTVAFEFGFGHYVAGHSWQKLLADYNLFNGRVWLMFLIWLSVMPFIMFKFTSRVA